eukprot:6269444-Amphidinium_carterae.1
MSATATTIGRLFLTSLSNRHLEPHVVLLVVVSGRSQSCRVQGSVNAAAVGALAPYQAPA